MRFDRLRARGLGPFKEEIDLDLSALSGEVTAVCGSNGAGKSTLLGLLAAGMYREIPLMVNGKVTRQTLATFATARDAFVELSCVNGKSLRITQTVDNISGKGESVVVDMAKLDAEGRPMPLLPTTSIKQYGAWRRQHLPEDDVLYASTFAPQGSSGVLSMTDGDRRHILLRAVGAARHESVAKRAGERGTAAKKALDVAEARALDERARSGDVAGAEASLAAARLRVVTATTALEASRAKLAEVRAAADAAREANAKNDEHRARIAAARARGAALDQAVADLDVRLANNRAVLAEADAIRAAATRLAEIDPALEAGRAEDAKLTRDAAQADTDRLRLEGDERKASERAKVEADRATRARALLADRAAVEAAVAKLDALRSEVVAASELADIAERELSEVQAERLAGAVDRIAALRVSLLGVEVKAATLHDAQTYARAGRETDDKIVADAAAHPWMLDAANVRLTQTRTALRVVTEELSRAVTTAARLPAIEQAVQGLAVAEAARAVALEEERVAAIGAGEAQARRSACVDRFRSVRARLDALTAERAQLAPIAARADRLAGAEARVAELEPQRAADLAEREALAPVLAELIPDVVVVPDVATEARHVEAAEIALRDAGRAEALAEKLAGDARAVSQKLAALDAERDALADEIADFALLADAFGSKGIPALVVDASAGEITAIANELLHEAFGPRFSVELTTVRTADAGHEVETCSLQVLDTENGRVADAVTFSGGEKVILGEALALALATVACRRMGVEGSTIVRDESGAALDASNSLRYIAMVRRCMKLVKASRALIVSHSPEVWAACDGTIRVADGKAEVRA